MKSKRWIDSFYKKATRRGGKGAKKAAGKQRSLARKILTILPRAEKNCVMGKIGRRHYVAWQAAGLINSSF